MQERPQLSIQELQAIEQWNVSQGINMKVDGGRGKIKSASVCVTLVEQIKNSSVFAQGQYK